MGLRWILYRKSVIIQDFPASDILNLKSSSGSLSEYDIDLNKNSVNVPSDITADALAMTGAPPLTGFRTAVREVIPKAPD